MMTSSAIARLPEVPLLCEALDGLWKMEILRVQFSVGLRTKEELGADAWALGQILALLEELGESLPVGA